MAKRFSYDIISIGDTTTDVFLKLEDASMHCDINKKHCKLCVSYADKIPLEAVKEVDGVGNAANNVVGSARLGMKAGIWTIVGDDQNGHDARSVFREEGVSPRYVEIDKKLPTNYSAVINFQGERTILVHHEHRTYRFPKLPSARFVYLTSMGKGWERIIRPLLQYLKRTGAQFGFNPGTHQMLSGLETLRPLIEVTDVFIVNVEEAQRILGSTEDPPALLRKLHKQGAKIVVITDGMKGAHVFDGQEHWHVPPYPDPGPVVERTGAGDAFSTGVLAAFANEKSMMEAMQWGAANSRMVVQYIGAQEGLQTKTQIQRVIRKFKNVRPKKIS